MRVPVTVWNGPPESLYDAATREADAHKWIVSEQRGCDAGFIAWSEWWERFWPEFCRHRRLEHVRGVRRWQEFEDEAFAHFYDLVVQGDLLLELILDRVAEGWENLDFACWIHDWGLPRERVFEILEVININEFRGLKPPRKAICV
ncbi:hypothetical protein [Maioricimonas sp. JC845]|uniref:hypothetical protein n=1 Tax=Maioricimonas sp. JC845 TaxID=3232138 RepID=UPI0034585D61